MSSCLLYEPNHPIRAFIATPELQFQNSNPRGKIMQNINFLPISQNRDLILKLDLIRKHESRDMLDFQNRVSDVNILKFHTSRDNNTYLKKRDFQ